MKIIVCIRQGLDGQLGPFDASAYEAAIRTPGAEVTLLSMGPESAKDYMLSLTRLGAKKAVLLSDKAFAGADTLATAYALSLAIKKLSPDLVFCGRQTLIGDTGQTPFMIAEMLGFTPISEVMNIISLESGKVVAQTRSEGEVSANIPALLSFERIYNLRLPSLRSKNGEVEIWSAQHIGADISRTGLAGSPTRVIKTFENSSGKRKCKFITRSELDFAISEGIKKESLRASTDKMETLEKLPLIIAVNGAPTALIETVAERILEISVADTNEACAVIKDNDPDAVIFGSDAHSKRLAACVAARLELGLCADLTRLECEGCELMMYRPALSGSIIAKIRSQTRPAMATVRSVSSSADVIFGIGYGVKDKIEAAKSLADSYGATLCASRKLVDNAYMNYSDQVGLTGKTVSPAVYVAIGISGAVHHIAGMERSGTVIAINPDKNAPIFEYADYGIVDEF